MRISPWLRRGALPLLAALAAAPITALPANALVSTPVSETWAGGVTAAPSLAAEWWLRSLSAQLAWGSAPHKGAGETVAVLSTGVDAGHQDLTGSVTSGPDYTGSGRHPGGRFWGAEGTAIASLIAGHGHGPGGAEGITGIAPRARILSVRVTLDNKDPLTKDSSITRQLPGAVARGIEYAVSHGARVIALPQEPAALGASPHPAADGSVAERAAVRDAVAHNVVLIAPAGDDGTSGGTSYPAAFPGVIAVGATGTGGKLASFSSTGSYVALTAPGAGVTAAAPGSGYTTLSTTDAAAALTAGIAALVRSRYPGLTAAEVTKSLKSGVTATKVPRPGTGAGGVNAMSAITSAASIFSLIGNPMPNPAPAWQSFVARHPGVTAPGLLPSGTLTYGGLAVGAVIGAGLIGWGIRRRRRRADGMPAGGNANRTPERAGNTGTGYAAIGAQTGPVGSPQPAPGIPAPELPTPAGSRPHNLPGRVSATDALTRVTGVRPHPEQGVGPGTPRWPVPAQDSSPASAPDPGEPSPLPRRRPAEPESPPARPGPPLHRLPPEEERHSKPFRR